MSKYYLELEDVIQRLVNAIYEANRGAMSYDEALKRLRIAYAETMSTINIVFCEECKYAPYCEQRLVKELFGNEIAEWREVDFCQHGERIEE